MNEPHDVAIDQLLGAIESAESRSRRNALLYSLVPIAVAAILVLFTTHYLISETRQVRKAQNEAISAAREASAARNKIAALQTEIERANRQLQKSASTFVSIAKATRQLQALIEAKAPYLRS